MSEPIVIEIDGNKLAAVQRAIWLINAEKEVSIGGKGREDDDFQVVRLGEAYRHEAQQLGLMIIREVEAALK